MIVRPARQQLGVSLRPKRGSRLVETENQGTDYSQCQIRPGHLAAIMPFTPDSPSPRFAGAN